IGYQMAEQKCRFQTAQSHIDKGLKVRGQGMLGEALLEFQKAVTINPGSIVAEQEIRRTTDMIERERRRVQETGKESPPEVRAATPAELARKDANDRIDSILPIPELRAINNDPINLRTNASPKPLIESVGK